MKRLGALCLLISFVVSAINVQGFLTLFYGESIGQLTAYLLFGLVVIGMFIFISGQKQPLPYLIKLWIWFSCFYLSFGLLASANQDTSVEINSIIPIIYFVAFSSFLSYPEYQIKLSKIVTIVFVLSCILLIVLQHLNFSMDTGGIAKYNLERAGGVYGDANNASLVCLLAFIFVQHIFKPVSKFQKISKFIISAIVLYALVLTFSKTGFIVLLIVLGLTYHKWFNHKRIFLTMIIAPLLFFTTINFALESIYLSAIQKERVGSILNILYFQSDKIKFSDRDRRLQNMINYINENPILGNGIDFYVNIGSHNTIFGVWADAGIFVFLFFLFLLFQHFRKSILAPVEKRYFALSIFFVLTIFMLSLQTVINQPYLIVIFVWVGYLISGQNINLNPNKSQTDLT